jgi:DnaJ-class molecular chaperone
MTIPKTAHTQTAHVTAASTRDGRTACKPCNGKGTAWDQSEEIECPSCKGTKISVSNTADTESTLSGAEMSTS